MSDIIPRDDINAYVLKECYELALQFEESDIAKSLLREKSKKIGVTKSDMPGCSELYSGSDMQVISEAFYALSHEGSIMPNNTDFPNAGRIYELMDSGEKEYLLALLCLRRGTNEANRIEALRYLSAARSYSPNDPRYIALITVLQEASK